MPVPVLLVASMLVIGLTAGALGLGPEIVVGLLTAGLGAVRCGVLLGWQWTLPTIRTVTRRVSTIRFLA